jgi:hypothetical protein
MHRDTHQDKPKKRAKKAKPSSKQSENKLEGEGSYEAGRNYDEHARQFVREGSVEPAAEEAKRAVDEEPEALRDAEDEARRGPRH